MTDMEKGLVLTFETMMKVKNQEINEVKQAFKLETEVLYEEIHQRDNELDRFQKELEDLKAANETLKTQNKELKTQNEDLKTKNIEIEAQMDRASRRYEIELELNRSKAHHELDIIWKIHHVEMKRKCENDVRYLKSQNQNSTEEELLTKYCSQQFTYEKLNLHPIPSDEEIKLKIQSITERQLAVLAFAEERNFSDKMMDLLKDDLQERNISILKKFLTNFGCRTAKAIVPKFIKIFDVDGEPRKYDECIEHKLSELCGCMSDYELFGLYNFHFYYCENCDYNCDEYCFYTNSY